MNIEVVIFYYKLEGIDDIDNSIKNNDMYFLINHIQQKGLLYFEDTKEKIISKIKRTNYWDGASLPFYNNIHGVYRHEGKGSFTIIIDVTEEEMFYLKLKYDFKTTKEIFNDMV